MVTCSKQLSALRTERLCVCAALKDLILVFSVPGVTPPLVNTGLEVSSEDKNTLASQPRGENARIPPLLYAHCAQDFHTSPQEEIFFSLSSWQMQTI